MFEFKKRQPSQRLFYKTVNGIGLPMDIYLPKNGLNLNTRCVVAIHGGGWNEAIVDNSEWDGGRMKYQARYFAERDCIGIAFSYRSLKFSDDMTVFDILEDCYDAMKYIRSLDFVNYNTLTVIGDSAGGHIALMLGMSQNDELRPYAVIACNPVSDCMSETWSYGFRDCDNKIEASPMHLEPKKCAKFLFVHGTSDACVNISDSIELCDKLKNMGHNSDMITLKDAKHAFVLYDYHYDDGYVTSIMNMIYEYYIKL